jgi:hypothetical protein
VYGAHGHAFTVDVDDLALQRRITTALSTLRLEGEAPTGTYRVAREDNDFWGLMFDGEKVGERHSDDGLLLLLHWHINQRVIDRAAAARTTFHAAAAVSPGGCGVLLAAPMESGKTTTVTGLLRAGWAFLTDEAAAVDADGTVWAYPKPLTIDRGSWPLFPMLEPAGVGEYADSWLVPAPAAGAAVAAHAPLGLIVFPGYQAGQATEAVALRASEAALLLAQSTFQFDRYGARDLRTVSNLARSLPAYRLAIGDLDEAVTVIGELAARVGRPHDS